MSSHIFVDETKRAGYVIAAVTVSDTEAIRKTVRALVLPGQRRIHMKARAGAPSAGHRLGSGRNAGPSHGLRRRASLPDRSGSRTACLTALVDDIAARDSVTRLAIEQDDC